MIPHPLTVSEALESARETRRLEIGRGILARTPAIFAELCPQREAILIADAHTHAAAGKAVQAAFEAAGIRTRAPFIIDDPALYAEMRFVDQVTAALRDHDAVPVAVGSGTINDLTKLAAHRCARPSFCVATAASMDGYTAFGSSITYLGSKQTFDCPAPLAVIADLEVIGAAPPKMSGWGYADMSAKITAGADWILADALGVEPIGEQAWNIAQGSLRLALGDPAGVLRGETRAMGHLVEALMLGGFAMQATRSSRPASGAEHQFSHLWDMQHHTHEGHAPSHGAKVGIGTLAITALYEVLLAMDVEQLDVEAAIAKWPSKSKWLRRAEVRFEDAELRAVAGREIAAKYSEPSEVRRQLQRLKACWGELRVRLQNQLVPFEELRQKLRDVGAATESEEIGISRSRLRETYVSAFFIRRRFTVLDVAVRAGLLDACLGHIFGPQGRWPLASTP